MVVIKLNSEELEGNFKELLEAAIKQATRKEVDILISKHLTEIIDKRLSTHNIKSRVDTEIENFIDKACTEAIFKHSGNSYGNFGMIFPHEFNTEISNIISEKIVKKIDVEVLEHAVKQSIKDKIMKDV